MAEEPIRIERREERLAPRTTPVPVGRVRLDRHVTDERQELEVDVSRHEVSVERRTVDRPRAADEQTVQRHDGSTVLLVTEERLEVRKVPWVVEEIHLNRREVTDRRRLHGTVRRETFDIETDGDVDLHPITTKGTEIG
jgi:uncharacterized protein (TIGR02271 family)